MRLNPLPVAALLAASAAIAQTPRAVIPRELAHALVHGDTRLVIVGDSLSVNSMGDPNGASHCPLPVGIAHRWRPTRWRGLYSQPAWPNGGFGTLRGVGASSYDHTDTDDRSIALNTSYIWPGGLISFATEESLSIRYLSADNPAWWNPRVSFRLFTSTFTGSPPARQLLLSPTLRARNIVYTHPAMTPMNDLVALLYNDSPPIHLTDVVSSQIGNTTAGWTTVDIPVGAMLPDTFNRAASDLRMDFMVRPAAGPNATYITMGVLWDDPAVQGLQVHSIAQGGWNTADHAGLSSARGYSDMAIRENLRVFGFADPGVTPVVMITLGSNLSPGEADANGPSQTFTDNINAVIARYDNALTSLGVTNAWFILVGMHSLDFPPDIMATGRAARLYDIALSRPRTAFFSVPAMLGLRGEGFQTSWYYRHAQATVTESVPQSATTLPVASTLGFWHPQDQFYIIDGPNRVRGSYSSLSSNALLNVQLTGPVNSGARVLPASSIDIHFSRAGSEAVADAMWLEVLAALGRPCDADYNGDGDSGTDQDIESFFRVLSGGPC